MVKSRLTSSRSAPSQALDLDGPFDHLTSLACAMLGTSHAMVGVIDGERTVFRSGASGLGQAEMPRDLSVTKILVGMGADAELVIENALETPGVAEHPMVVGEPHLRFFAGVTVKNAAGRPVGAIGVMDTKPRARPDAAAMGVLHTLAGLAGEMVDKADLARSQTERIDLLRLAEEMAGIGQWRLDLATRSLRWSDEVYRIHGLSRDTFDPNREDSSVFYHPDDLAMLRRALDRTRSEGTGYHLILRMTRPDGEARVVESRADCELDEDGKPAALIGVFQDITEREQSRKVLADSEAAFRALADRTGDIISVFDLKGVISYLSPAVERVLGWTPDELTGTRTWDLIHPDDHEAVRATYEDMLAAGPGGERRQLRYRGRRKDGGWAWLEAQPTIMWNAAGGVTEIQDSIRDVSRTQRLEAELVEARDRAEAAARTKSEFLSNMSHELRTPLTAVIGFAGLLRTSSALADADRRHVERISTASASLLGVINDILDYSKLEAGRVDLDPMPFDPRRMVEGTAAMLEEQAGAKGLSLVADIDAAVPAGIMADEGRLRQVLLNFLSNGVKFTSKGEVRVRLHWRDAVLRVEVRDSGIGIPQETLDRLFERFVQADASTTRQFGGTGLGLSISRRLIDLMGGRIGAESTPGEGSTFWFEAPAPEAEPDVAPAANEALGEAGALRVLMADDAPANRELVTMMLTSLGLHVDAVENGAEAVEAARTGGYDVILMDVHMPVMDGLDATRAIRWFDGPAARIPIVALTANVQPEQVVLCREAGMDAHVAKPIQPAELLRTLVAVTTPEVVVPLAANAR